MVDLIELAGRCEAATGADRELDRAIKELVGDPWDYTADWDYRDASGEKASRPVAKPYTASLDAAMALKGDLAVLITLSEIKGDGMPHCVLGNPATSELFEAVAATPALALCAAALRVRAGTQ